MTENSDVEVATFLKVLEALAGLTADKTPKKLNDSILYLLERAKGFEGGSIELLAKHSCSSSPLKTRSSSKKKTPSTEYFSAGDIAGVVSLLEVASIDAYRFKDVVDQYNKDLSAPAMKAVAAAFARAPKPKTKADAVRLLVAARNERVRADHKTKESESSKPW